MKEANIPSLSACIIKNTSMVWDRGYGTYNRLLGLSPSNQTVYMAASISKTITATALLQLYEKGLFSLDEDVSKYLPFVLRNPNYPESNITFHMLLSHQSSLPINPLKDILLFWIIRVLFPNTYPCVAIKELLVPGGIFYRPDVWSKNKPGEVFTYSNTGFFILQYLVERLSHQSFDEYCKSHILEPLEMYHSSFDFKNHDRHQRAVPFLLIKDILLRIPFYNVPESGAGGLLTTVEDLSHFLIMQMNNGTYNGSRILDNSSVELMQTFHIQSNNTSLIYNYGYGWMFYNISGTLYQGHDGGTPGFTARMVYNEMNKTGVIFFFNRSTGTKEDILRMNELMEMLFVKTGEL